jgi:hypothetical protein
MQKRHGARSTKIAGSKRLAKQPPQDSGIFSSASHILNFPSLLGRGSRVVASSLLILDSEGHVQLVDRSYVKVVEEQRSK